MQTYDVIVVGGGPSGSACATSLVKGGARVVVVDSATFPRDKLCCGWVTPPFWDVLELSPREYPLGLWEWHRGHVHFAGRTYTLSIHGYFIRRIELDGFLLRRSGATIVQGHFVRDIERGSDGAWEVDGLLRAKYLVGAGGSRCPVARALFPRRANAPCGTQEKEFEADPEEIAAYRMGEDGEPEILLHDDLRGYSWNIPKSRWLNIGTGTGVAREVLPAWYNARAFFESHGTSGTVPPSARPMLDRMKGHGYSGFAPEHFETSAANNAFLVGDSFGLAHPLTGEGLLPAVLSGKLCGQAIAEGAPEIYPQRLRAHPIMTSYRVAHAGQWIAAQLGGIAGDGREGRSPLFGRLVVDAFGALFSGKPIPGNRRLARLLDLRRSALRAAA